MSQKLDEIGFPINLSSTSKDDVFYFIISHPKLCLTHRRNFKYRFPELYDDFLQMIIPEFASDWKFSQLLWHFLQDDTNFKLGICKCGNRCNFNYFCGNGYNQHCCAKCADEDPHKLKLFKSTCKDKFGVEFPQQNKELKNRAVKTATEKYGGVGFDSKEILKKSKETRFKKYGNEEYRNTNKAIKTCNLKYQCNSYPQTDEYKSHMKCIKEDWYTKQITTKRLNHSFKSSSVENKLKIWLDENHINYIQHYRDKNRYNFICDFYFPQTDLFLEINGTWTHGFHPYLSDENDKKTLLNWQEKSKNSKYYQNAIENWTIRDVEKRDIAKKNNLNWIEIFSTKLDDILQQIRDRI